MSLKKNEDKESKVLAVAPEVAPKRPEKNFAVGLIDKLIKGGLYLLTFLLPIFFLPFTSEVLEFNKQYLLLFISAILFLLWLGKMLAQSEIRLARTPLNLAVFAFLIVNLISAIFSHDRYQSLAGFNFSISESFITTLSFVLLYFVILNNVSELKAIRRLVFIFIGSLFLAMIYGVFQAFGLYILPWAVVKTQGFNTVGTSNALEIFFGLGVIGSILYLARADLKLKYRITASLLGLFFLAGAFLFNFKNIWLSLGVAFILILGLTMSRRESFLSRWLIAPMILLGLFVLFYFIPYRPLLLKNLPSEVLPSFQFTVDIAKGSLKEAPIFGSGPGTWIFNYTKYKKQEINLTNFWNIRFAKGWSNFFMLPATVGILGALSWLVMILLFLFGGLKYILKLSQLGAAKGSLALFLLVGWFYLMIFQFLYSVNLTLQFAFWLLMALFAALVSLKKDGVIDEVETGAIAKRRIRIPFEATSPLSSIFSFVFVALIVATIISFWFLGQSYAAEVVYSRGLKLISVNGNLTGGADLLEKATLLNPRQDFYYRALAQTQYLFVQQELKKINGGQTDRSRADRIKGALDKMLIAAKRATEISPNNVENWTQRGLLYQNAMNFIGGADVWAETSFAEAIKLDPINPFLYTELARAYSLAANLTDDKAKKQDFLIKAEDRVNKAIELKNNYAPAYVLLTLIYEGDGRMDEALAQMEKVKPLAANDANLAFRLGYLYYRQNRLDEAEAAFESAVSLADNFSNARYFLGLIHDKKGHSQAAIEQFERIATLNPGNQDVQKILDNLRNGQPALVGVTPISVGEEQVITPSAPGR